MRRESPVVALALLLAFGGLLTLALPARAGVPHVVTGAVGPSASPGPGNPSNVASATYYLLNTPSAPVAVESDIADADGTNLAYYGRDVGSLWNWVDGDTAVVVVETVRGMNGWAGGNYTTSSDGVMSLPSGITVLPDADLEAQPALTLTKAPGSVTVHWPGLSARNVVGFTVYRASSPAGPFSPVGDVPAGSGPPYAFVDPVAPGLWCYQLSTNYRRDLVGGEYETTGRSETACTRLGSPARILTTSPWDAQAGVPLAAPIVVTFSEAMDTGSVTGTFSDPGISFAPTWNGPTNTVLTLDHAQAFAYCTDYTMRIAGKDANDQMDLAPGPAPNPWMFHTICPAPIIMATIPPDGTRDVGWYADIEVTFSLPMNTTSVTWSFSDPSLPFSNSWSRANMTLTLSHVAPYDNCRNYTMAITAGKSAAGFDLVPGPVPNPWSFASACSSPPTASFTVTPPSGDVTTVFTANASASSDPEDPPSLLVVRWDWEDDGTWDTTWSTTKTAQHQYALPGVYTIRLQVRDVPGLVDSTTRSVSVGNAPPVASFTVSPASGSVTTTFTANASASSDAEDPAGSLEVRWDWEDDGVWDTTWNTTKTAQHQYSLVGDYTIRLEVRDTGGLVANATESVSVVNTAPSAFFTVSPFVGTIATTFTMNASSSFDLEDPAGTLEFRWDWEDDGAWDTAFSTTPVIQHQYAQVGAYVVRLEVRDSGGLTATTTFALEVQNTPPVAAFTVNPAAGTIATVFAFDPSGTHDLEDAPSALEARWDWEDDGTFDTLWSPLTDPFTHQYAAVGAYVVRLEVLDTLGLASATTATVWVNNTAPVASFAVTPSAGDITTSFAADASASRDLEDPASALEVRWDWEDDGTWDTAWSSTKTAQHQYPAVGTYTIRMEVRDTLGLASATTATVWVNNTAPVASFVVTPATGTTLTTFSANASASSDLEDAPSALEVRWDWEDDGTWDTTSTAAKTATHQYASFRNYTIRLEVRDTGGLTATTTRTVAVADDEPPTIAHTPHGDVLVGEAIAITAQVVDNVGVRDVYLHYRAVGAASYATVRMEPAGGDAFVASVPAQTAPGTVSYYVNATDVAGNDARSPAAGDHAFAVAQPESPISPYVLVGGIAALVVVLAVLVAVVLRRRRKKAAPKAVEDETEAREEAEPEDADPSEDGRG